jgi:hypothetical protein
VNNDFCESDMSELFTSDNMYNAHGKAKQKFILQVLVSVISVIPIEGNETNSSDMSLSQKSLFTVK